MKQRRVKREVGSILMILSCISTNKLTSLRIYKTRSKAELYVVQALNREHSQDILSLPLPTVNSRSILPATPPLVALSNSMFYRSSNAPILYPPLLRHLTPMIHHSPPKSLNNSEANPHFDPCVYITDPGIKRPTKAPPTIFQHCAHHASTSSFGIPRAPSLASYISSLSAPKRNCTTSSRKN